MKIINDLTQGTDAWHAHRSTHFNASDAAAMLNISPYKTRGQLLREKATGIAPEVDAATQRRFDVGHRLEAFARPEAEAMIGEELYPCVGVLEGSKLSASFDGITLDQNTVWEHKTLNEAIRCALAPKHPAPDALPEHYRVQLEQQLLVSGAEKALFMATYANGDDPDKGHSLIMHCWYESDPALRQRIIDGWAQFEKDLAEYVVEPLPAPAPTGRTPETLPALNVRVTGSVLASNVAEFKTRAFAVLDGINRNLQTDQDFADAEQTGKWCRQVEQKLADTKTRILAQTADIDTVLRTLDDISERARSIRLELDKLVKAEKENRKRELIEAANKQIFDHHQDLNDQLEEFDDQLNFTLAVPQPFEEIRVRLTTSIKGKSSLESIRSALSVVVAEEKIAANKRFNRIRANAAVLIEHTAHRHLLPDAQSLGEHKDTDDLKNLIAARIAEHEAREQARIERERQAQVKENAATLPYDAAKVRNVTAQNHSGDIHEMVTPKDSRLLKLGDINQLISPLSITAAGLETFGFHPVASQGAAKLYAADAFTDMLFVMVTHLRDLHRELRESDQRAYPCSPPKGNHHDQTPL